VAEGSSGIPVMVMGLGHLGQAIARAVLEKPELRLVGAVDPARGGGTLAEILGQPAPRITVDADPARALDATQGGVVLHATASSFEAVHSQIELAVRAGLSVVSTCEELAYPWLRHERLADRLDRLCEAKDVAVIGLGVNPGFTLDRLPAFLSQVVGEVRHVRASRAVDLAPRPAGRLRKWGVGLSEEAFLEAVDRGELGHAGLAESATLAALGCGFELDEIEEEIDPVLADRDLEASVPLPRGRVAGLRQQARGFAAETERVRLEVVLAVGADPRDEVALDAAPPLQISIPGGVPGTEAAAWSVVNAAPAVTMLRGLVTVLDLPAGR